MRLGTILSFYTFFLVCGLIGWYFWNDAPPPPPPKNTKFIAVADPLPTPKPTPKPPAVPATAAPTIPEDQVAFNEVQTLLMQGNRHEALELLESKRFSGKAESERLIQLAAIHMVESPQMADAYLSEALNTDPDNADLHLFKGNLHESLQQHDSALSAYIKAVKKNPSNPYLREHLADFLLSHAKYPEALAVLQDSLVPPSLDSLWLKALFWSKVTVPLKGNTWARFSPPRGPLAPFVSYLQKLPAGVYWNQNIFKSLPDAQEYLDTLQATFWLRLIAALKGGDESEALRLVDTNNFHAVSWAPKLEKSLKTILVYRKNAPQTNKEGLPIAATETPEEEAAQFLTLLSGMSELSAVELVHTIPAEWQECLLGHEAFALAFLANGWLEAALQLHQGAILPDSYPDWMAVLLMKAIRQNRGVTAALEWADKQKHTVELSLLVLADKEQLARTALKENQPEKAFKIYSSIEQDSLEAKSFLARDAFAKKEWKNARRFTEELLKKYPTNTILMENLKRISREEGTPP